MTVINRETSVKIGWGVASYSADHGYRIVDTRATRTTARAEAKRRNENSAGTRYRTVRLAAMHP